MKSSSRLPPSIAGTAGWSQLEVVTSVPFTKRADAVRLQQQQLQSRQRKTQRGPFRALLACIAIGIALTTLVTWYLQRQLPEIQKRAKESEILHAPPSRSFCDRPRPPMVCAHGGDTRHAPPNTAAAFRAALAAGVDCVEVDAALSADGVLLVTHVRELALLSGRGGVQAGDLTAEQLLGLRWPSGEGLLRVEEAVNMTAPFVECVTLDVKTYNDAAGRPLDEEAISRALVSVVHATRCGNCLIWAKSDAVVRRILQLSPGQRTGYIVMNETEESRRLGMHHPLRFSPALGSRGGVFPGGDDVAYEDDDGGGPSDGGLGTGSTEEGRIPHPAAPFPASKTGRNRGSGSRSVSATSSSSSVQPQQQQQHPQQQQPGVVGVHQDMVDSELLEALHGQGKLLYAWTINQPEVLRRVLDVGVDALVTNHPLTAMEAIEARLARCGSDGGGRGGGDRGSGGDDRGKAAAPQKPRHRGKWSSSSSGSGGDYL